MDLNNKTFILALALFSSFTFASMSILPNVTYPEIPINISFTINNSSGINFVWLNVTSPDNSIITYNITEFTVGLDYQETADEISCIVTGGSTCSGAYDGDWDTSASVTSVGTLTLYENYTKPQSTNATWEIKWGGLPGQIGNFTINQTCFDYSEDRVMVRITSTGNVLGDDIDYHCYNGSWIPVHLPAQGLTNDVYEDAFWWYANTENYSDNLLFNDTTQLGFFDTTLFYNLSTGTILQESSNFTVNLTFTNCSAGSASQTEYLKFWIRDELTDSLLSNATAQLTFFDDDYGNFSFDFADIYQNFSICVFPTDTTINYDMSMLYDREGYDARSYFLDNATLTNSTQNITLYLLNDSSSDLVTFRVQNENQEPLIGANLYILKENLGNGSYDTVAIGLTNSEGEYGEYIELNKWYRFTVIRSGVTFQLQNQDPVKITSDEVFINVITGEAGTYWDTFDQISWTCVTNYTNNYTQCQYLDSSGLFSRACLNVTRTAWNVSTRFYNCLQTVSGSVSYTYSDPTAYYEWDFNVEYTDGTENTLESGFFTISVTPEYGSWSLLLVALIVISMGMAGTKFGAPTTILMGGMGLILCGVVGLAAISNEWIIGLFFTTIIGAFAVGRL